jgi:ferritin-like metal-binding protein YciE
MASLKDLYVAEIADLMRAEREALPRLQRLADAAHAPELKEALTRHADVSRLHLERLQLIEARLGVETPAGRSPGAAALLEQADARVANADTPDVRDATIIGAAQRLEHYEIAAYGCARAYARRLDRGDDAELLETSLGEEGMADHRLTEIAEAHVNDDARTEADLYEQPHGTRLKYVGPDRLDHSRLAAGPLNVTNDAGEDLGVFDGVIVDAAAARPSYIVLRSPGLFSHERHLIPVAQVGFDERARVLVVNLDQDLVRRYPAFDPDEFQALRAEAAGGYHARVVDSLERSTPHQARSVRTGGGVPEWLMTGVWVTVSPEHAERLTDAVHSFANEFGDTGRAHRTGS